MSEVSEIGRTAGESARRAVRFFESQLQKDGSYPPEASDLCCYFKSPMMFLAAGNRNAANLQLSFIQSRFMTQQGDFKTDHTLKSLKPQYREYWTYMNGWICRAAHHLRRNDVFEPAYRYLLKSRFLTNRPDATNGITDVLTAAHQGLIDLECGNAVLAESATNYLLDAYNKQPSPNRCFYLRFDLATRSPLTEAEPQQASFYCISRNTPDQFYFMLGYPAGYLGKVYEETRDEKHLEGARKYLDYALNAGGNPLQSDFSHKLAWASSILYRLTRNESYLDATVQIVHHFTGKQLDNGLWYADTDWNSAYDQSAEIATWFFDIEAYLQT